jgi:hypothetical protein
MTLWLLDISFVLICRHKLFNLASVAKLHADQPGVAVGSALTISGLF